MQTENTHGDGPVEGLPVFPSTIETTLSDEFLEDRKNTPHLWWLALEHAPCRINTLALVEDLPPQRLF